MEVTQNSLFDLHYVEGLSLWMPPLATMETMMKVFNEDIMAYPKRAHVFVVPRLMTYL